MPQVGLREAGVHRVAQHGVEVTVGTEGPRGSHRPPCGDCLRLCIDDQESDAGPLREMRVGVRLCAGSGRSWLLRLSSRQAEVLLRAALCCAEGLRGRHCCPSPHCRGLRAGRPVCPGASGRLHLCMRQRPLLRGASAQRHRSASFVEEKPAPREAPQQHISRHPRSAALARCCVPMKKSCN